MLRKEAVEEGHRGERGQNEESFWYVRGVTFKGNAGL